MSEKPMSPLRRRMIEDMTVRNFTPDTQRDDIRAVKNLAAFLGRSPETATPEDLRRFQLHLTQSGVRAPTINGTVTALRFFFKVTLDRPDATRHLAFVYEPRKMPTVLRSEEVARLLEAAAGPKYKAALSLAYGAGLRAMEVVSLKVSDIDSKRMMLRIPAPHGWLRHPLSGHDPQEGDDDDRDNSIWCGRFGPGWTHVASTQARGRLAPAARGRPGDAVASVGRHGRDPERMAGHLPGRR